MIKIAIKIKKRYQGRQRDFHNDFINRNIKFDKLLVIGPNGEKLGILSKSEALIEADKYELDLVLITSKSNPPVAKIIDYGKFRFERKKKESESKKNQKQIETKEIRLRPNIGENDLNVKIKSARIFLRKGNRVKISLSFKGREMTNKEIGLQTINKFLKSLEDIAQIDSYPKQDGRFLNALISPIKNLKEKK